MWRWRLLEGGVSNEKFYNVESLYSSYSFNTCGM